ncbi:uncharacterized protein LOC131928817 [Physella acuta]|uniref:uncharacterized protein LOC131928817 n=1 Tax=Physella acuta TaxID=109671 RepID=UPI0027DC5F5C|nr:uncharacterized protein LOC131928817 [Physella acuta]
MAHIIKVCLLLIAVVVVSETGIIPSSNCQPLRRCVLPDMEHDSNSSYSYFNNSFFEPICQDLDKYKACVRAAKDRCKEVRLVIEKRAHAAFASLFCSEDGKQAVEEFQANNCTTDIFKMRMLDVTNYFCSEPLELLSQESGVTCCALNTTWNCLKSHATRECGAAGGQLFAMANTIDLAEAYTDDLCDFDKI